MKEYSFKYKIDNVLSYNPRRCNLPHLVAANKSGFLRAYSMIKDRFRYRYVYEYVLMTTSMFDGLPCSVFLHDVRRKRLPDVVSDVVMLAALGPWSRDPEDYDYVYSELLVTGYQRSSSTEPSSFVGAILLLPEPEWAAGCWLLATHLSCTSHHDTRYSTSTSNYIDIHLNQ